MKRLDYQQLASLPLFLGIDGATLWQLYATLNLVMAPMRKGSTIASEGNECRSLIFLLEGHVSASTSFSNKKITLYEELPAVTVLEPQCLFGLHTTYTHTFTAIDEGHYLKLPKNVIVQQLMNNEVFRFNYINMLSSITQESARHARALADNTIESRLASIIYCNSIRSTGHKLLKCKLVDLAPCLASTRLALSHALHGLKDKGLVNMTRGMIEFPAFEDFLSSARQSK